MGPARSRRPRGPHEPEGSCQHRHARAAGTALPALPRAAGTLLGAGRPEAPARPRHGSAAPRQGPLRRWGPGAGRGPAAPLTADDGADEGGVPRAVDQRELELAVPQAQLRRQRGAQAGEAQVQRDAPRPALRRPVEGGGGAGGAQRPRQRRLPAVDVAQDTHVHVEDAGRRGAGGHDGAAPGRSVPTAPLRQRGPRRRRSGAAASAPGAGKSCPCPSRVRWGGTRGAGERQPPPPSAGTHGHDTRVRYKTR